MIGQGKYSELCEAMVRAAEAEGVVLIVLGGNRGLGFRVAMIEEKVKSGKMGQIPDVLRAVAEVIGKDEAAAKKLLKNSMPKVKRRTPTDFTGLPENPFDANSWEN